MQRRGENQPKQSQHPALDAIVGFMKLEVTLAAGAVVLSATFLDNIFQGYSIWAMIVAWTLFGLSIVFGFFVHGEYITRLINNKTEVKRGERIEVLALLQTITLFAAFAFLATFAVMNVKMIPLPAN